MFLLDGFDVEPGDDSMRFRRLFLVGINARYCY